MNPSGISYHRNYNVVTRFLLVALGIQKKIFSAINYPMISELYSAQRLLSEMYPEKVIDPTSTGINISEDQQFWGGLTCTMDADYILSQSLDLFTVFNEVEEIYYSLTADSIDYFVLLNNEHYNSKLMRDLIKNEDIVKGMWLNREFDFHYAPISEFDKDLFLRNYKIAFKRN